MSAIMEGFRLLTEPASLKRRGARRCCRPIARRPFPAPHRAGLIEAEAREALVGAADEFPAPHRAGLIEATRPPDSRPGPRGFPAPHRAGLIEASTPRSAQRPDPCSCFRLLTEPASLKQVGRHPPCPWRREFPAPHRAGLIEASQRRLHDHEGGEFPAPHRAGLIEASRWRSATGGRSRSFRLLTEPASLKPRGGRARPRSAGPRVSGSSQSRPH